MLELGLGLVDGLAGDAEEAAVGGVETGAVCETTGAEAAAFALVSAASMLPWIVFNSATSLEKSMGAAAFACALVIRF
jgi:hypothetical protein